MSSSRSGELKSGAAYLVLALVGLLVAFALRVHRLGEANVWWDEGFTIGLARRPFPEMIGGTARDTHPPLYYMLLWPWIRLAGDGEFAARFPSVAFGVLTVAAAGAAGRRLGGPGVSLLALWLLGLSRFHIWWSQEIRMYALAALGIALSTLFALRTARDPGSIWAWGAWALASSIALFSVYLALFAWIPQSLSLLWAIPRRAWPRWLLAHGALVLLMSGWLAFAVPRMATWSAGGQPPTWSAVLQLSAVVWTTGISTYVERWAGPAALLIAGMLLGTAAAAREAARAPRRMRGLFPLILLGAGLALQPVAVWLITRHRAFLYTPRLEARYFLPALPYFSLLLAFSIAQVFSLSRLRPVALALGLGALSLSLASLPSYYADRHWRADLALLPFLIRAYAQPGDGVILVSGDRAPTFRYYYERIDGANGLPPVYPVPRQVAPVRSDTVEGELGEILRAHPRIWLARMESHLQDPEGWVERWLDAHLYRVLEFPFGRNGLILYVSSPHEPIVPVENPARMNEIHRLEDPLGIFLGYDRIGRTFRPGETMRIGLYLQSGRPLSLTVEWIRRPDQRVARAELHIPAGSGIRRRSLELPVTPYTPSGDYIVRVQAEWGGSVTIPAFRVEGMVPPPPPSPSEIAHPMSARLGDQIRFLGYRLDGVRARDPPEAGPGDTLFLDLYWEAEGPISRSYMVFTHLIGEIWNPATGNPVWAQDDQVPLEGAYPTTHWIPGQPLRDRYVLRLPAEMPSGDYLLEAGMYLLETGERLPVSGEGADPAARRLILGIIRVRPQR
jgi:mannosyltransferase